MDIKLNQKARVTQLILILYKMILLIIVLRVIVDWQELFIQQHKRATFDFDFIKIND